MLDIAEVVELYIAMWNEQDAERRRALVARTLTEDATYVDPLVASEGVDGIAAMIGAVQGQFPGFRFRLAAGPDLHHDRVRFTWQLHPGGRRRARRRPARTTARSPGTAGCGTSPASSRGRPRRSDDRAGALPRDAPAPSRVRTARARARRRARRSCSVTTIGFRRDHRREDRAVGDGEALEGRAPRSVGSTTARSSSAEPILQVPDWVVDRVAHGAAVRRQLLVGREAPRRARSRSRSTP